MRGLPCPVTSLLHQATAEIKLYWRSREAVLLTFVTPVMGMALFVYLNREGMLDKVFGFLFQGMTGRETAAGELNPLIYMTLGMIAYCIIAAAFEGPTPQLVRQREEGILKRLGGTPLPVWVLLVAKTLSASALLFIEVALILAVGLVSSDLTVTGSWWSLGLLLLLATSTIAAFSFILSSLVDSPDAAVVAVHAVYIPMLLLCGAFVPLEALPKALQMAARAMPLTYFVGPFRSVMVEGAGLATNSGDLLVLLAWMIGGWLVAIKLFRWE
jgi:ABC-2 type transport system permease protein